MGSKASVLDSNHSVRKAAMAALPKIDSNWAQSEAARSTRPYLVKALKNSNAYVRWAAKEALEKIP